MSLVDELEAIALRERRIGVEFFTAFCDLAPTIALSEPNVLAYSHELRHI